MLEYEVYPRGDFRNVAQFLSPGFGQLFEQEECGKLVPALDSHLAFLTKRPLIALHDAYEPEALRRSIEYELREAEQTQDPTLRLSEYADALLFTLSLVAFQYDTFDKRTRTSFSLTLGNLFQRVEREGYSVASLVTEAQEIAAGKNHDNYDPDGYQLVSGESMKKANQRERNAWRVSRAMRRTEGGPTSLSFADAVVAFSRMNGDLRLKIPGAGAIEFSSSAEVERVREAAGALLPFFAFVAAESYATDD